MRSIGGLNLLSQPEFAEALRPLFEAANPLAGALYAERPFASYDDLLERAERIAERLPPADQVRALNAHPRIGERPEAELQTGLRDMFLIARDRYATAS